MSMWRPFSLGTLCDVGGIQSKGERKSGAVTVWKADNFSTCQKIVIYINIYSEVLKENTYYSLVYVGMFEIVIKGVDWIQLA